MTVPQWARGPSFSCQSKQSGPPALVGDDGVEGRADGGGGDGGVDDVGDGRAPAHGEVHDDGDVGDDGARGNVRVVVNHFAPGPHNGKMTAVRGI